MTTRSARRSRATSLLRREFILGAIDQHLRHLTQTITDRSVGAPGNLAATDYVRDAFWNYGWAVDMQEFEVLDWVDGDAWARLDGGVRLTCSASPYSSGCDVQGPLVVASSLDDIRQAKTDGAVLLLTGDIAQTPFMPKNFPFYRDDTQQKIIATLEASGAAAIICATPHPPMIEDGDFDLPTVCLTENAWLDLSAHEGREVHVQSNCRRRPSVGRNVIARIGKAERGTLIITAHIDAKKGAPGALDNATGVTMLLVLARALAAYDGPYAIELVALNGEDHYAVPGQMAYLSSQPDLGKSCALNINIDGIGYVEGKTAYSFFQLPPLYRSAAQRLLASHPNACEGIQWPQGDHAIFVQAGCPAIAVTSQWLLDNMHTQAVTHSPSDQMGVVNPERLVESVLALQRFVEAI
ncbi:M28 family peptidase [Tateyamaria omphalii]|uniref:M28 family peptidase n=1 Tax=Tateyamaria omphalii TaxID=299262 RepID=UPI001C994BB4|nr:M28 family peptidase [Tateyamaria omphalii]MBY5931699.1 M28 family peptidase [Tateyamaria omphalii]